MSAAATHAIGWRVQTSAPATAEWGTPEALYRALDLEFGFTLDVAAAPKNAKHRRFVTKDTDALGVSWAGERVFCNPPFGRDLGRWMRKAFLKSSEHGALVVMHVPARTDTSWFHDVALPHAEIRFIRGRLSYTLGGPSRRARAPFASMNVIFRPHSRNAGRIEQQQLLMPFLPRVVDGGRP